MSLFSAVVTTSAVASHGRKTGGALPPVSVISIPPSRHELPAVITVVMRTFGATRTVRGGGEPSCELQAAHGVVSSNLHTTVELVITIDKTESAL